MAVYRGEISTAYGNRAVRDSCAGKRKECYIMTRKPLNPTAKPALTFQGWKAAVDQRLATQLCGLDSSDLPDCPYYDWYDQGVTVAQAARKAINAANE